MLLDDERALAERAERRVELLVVDGERDRRARRERQRRAAILVEVDALGEVSDCHREPRGRVAVFALDANTERRLAFEDGVDLNAQRLVLTEGFREQDPLPGALDAPPGRVKVTACEQRASGCLVAQAFSPDDDRRRRGGAEETDCGEDDKKRCRHGTLSTSKERRCRPRESGPHAGFRRVFGHEPSDVSSRRVFSPKRLASKRGRAMPGRMLASSPAWPA